MTGVPAAPADTPPRTIAISGTFDVGNFGDLLFPVVAAHRLAPHGFTVLPVAPTGRPTVFADALPARTLADIAPGATPIAGMLIGGGEIIHAWPARFLAEYREGDLPRIAYASLWLGASCAAALANAPIVWNAPGVMTALPEALRPHLTRALAAASYIAVRDQASAAHLPACAEVEVVPDTAAEMARLWPAASLAGEMTAVAHRAGIAHGEALLCLQVRPGGWGHDGPDRLAALAQDFARRHAMLPVLLSIGPSLDDRRTLRDLSAAMACRHVLLDAPDSLRGIAAVLAHARAYLGNSLHGYVVASGHGVPSAIVARPGFRKFAGFAEHLGRPYDVARSWEAGFVRLDAILAANDNPSLSPALLARLDRHWDRVADAISRPCRHRAARAALLRAAP